MPNTSASTSESNTTAFCWTTVPAFDLIAQPGRLLEFQFGARLLHVAGQLGDIRFADSAGHHADKLLAHPAMLVSADTVHAWSRAFADRCQQAWTARQLRLVEHVLRACAHGKRLQQRVEAVPKDPVPWRTGRNIWYRDVCRCESPIRVGCVRLMRWPDTGKVCHREHHVESWVEFLDPRVFECERLPVRTHYRPFEAASRQHHGLGAWMELVERLEVVRQPVAQVLGLANEDDAPLAVTPLAIRRCAGMSRFSDGTGARYLPTGARRSLFTPLPSDWVPAFRYCGFP